MKNRKIKNIKKKMVNKYIGCLDPHMNRPMMLMKMVVIIILKNTSL